MKPLFLIFALTATAMGQQISEPDNQASAADITRGRVGGDPSRTSTSVRVEGDANKGAGENALTGATSEGTLRIDPAAAAREAASGTTTLTVTGAATTQPAATTNGTAEGDAAAATGQGAANPSPSPASMDTGPGAER
jgi:hypothetical protein